ncbi:uncharacterized protein TNCV_2090851 [Trichonephila clavipes]|nr:uncharacterized protein TNCV_2090851 [Trichonephila clavipes]
MSWTYRWAVMVPRINTRGNYALWAMASHTIAPAMEGPCRCKTKKGLRRLPRGLHTRLSSLLRLNLDSSLKTIWFHSAAAQVPRAWHQEWVGVKGSTSNGPRNLKCPSIRRFCVVREDTGTPNEGATCDLLMWN